MSNRFKPSAARALMALLLVAPGVAFAAAPVTASGAWIRWLPGQIPLAGYVTLHNHGARALKLVDASSPAFKRIQLHHSMKMHGGMETMKPVSSVRIPAHGNFRFKPGDYHIMLWRKHALKVGEKVPITLEFKDGKRLRVMFTVKGPTFQGETS
ncbi:MAG: copper chaperone PCu(A)C [Gammaproteobacteria bacterium]